MMAKSYPILPPESFFKKLKGAGLLATVDIDPGYHAGQAEGAGPQVIPGVVFEGLASARYASEIDGQNRVRLGAVDPVVFSEVLADLHEILDQGR